MRPPSCLLGTSSTARAVKSTWSTGRPSILSRGELRESGWRGAGDVSTSKIQPRNAMDGQDYEMGIRAKYYILDARVDKTVRLA